MSHVFVWRPAAEWVHRAEESFMAVLEHERRRYSAAFQREFVIAARSVGSVWVGQLQVDNGLLGWSPWIDAGGRGVAWSGVCEEFLGRYDKDAVADEVTRTVLEHPISATEWQGAFAVVAWDHDRETLGLLTSATQPQSLWQTNGPAGWAAGSRARPLLDLVGRAPELDEVQATLYLGFGYLAGMGSLFRWVERVPSRRRISVGPHSEPQEASYISIPDFLLQGDTRELSFEDTLAFASERFAARVERQLRHSPNPMLSLTGGRDSRCIAAALRAIGYRGQTQTGGDVDAPDVIVAAQVARTLGFEHIRMDHESHRLDLMIANIDRARMWTELTEGIETIRHALHFPHFFEEPEGSPGAIHQMFNGLTPGLTVRSEETWGRAAVLARIGSDLLVSNDAKRRLQTIADRIERDVLNVGADPRDWAELFFWQNRALHWGQDNLAAKFGLTSWWTPLMDGTLVRASWWLPQEAKRSKRLVESMTMYLAPELAGVPYESHSLRRVEKAWKRIRRRLPSWIAGTGRGRGSGEIHRRRDWETMLFERERPVWPSLIDETHLRSVVASHPNAHLLWSIATIELFADAHLAYSGRERVTPPGPNGFDRR